MPALCAALLQVRDWYVDSFKELREFPTITNAQDEANFTMLLRSIYRRHANVVPVMAKVRALALACMCMWVCVRACERACLSTAARAA